MQQVRAGVVARRAPATVLVDACLEDRLAGREHALDAADVDDGVADALRVRHRHPPALAEQRAAVADLSAALRVERRSIEDGRPAAVVERLEADEAKVVRRRHVGIADEFARQPGQVVADRERATPLAPRAFALLGHGGVEARTIDGHAALRGHLDRQVDREAERVVQPERIGSADLAAGGDELVQSSGAGLQGARELVLLRLDGIEDRRTLLGK